MTGCLKHSPSRNMHVGTQDDVSISVNLISLLASLENFQNMNIVNIFIGWKIFKSTLRENIEDDFNKAVNCIC